MQFSPNEICSNTILKLTTPEVCVVKIEDLSYSCVRAIEFSIS